MNKQITEQLLQEKLQQLPGEITPERELWSGIERAIQGKAQAQVQPKILQTKLPMAWAATVIAAVLLTWLSIGPQQITPSEPSLAAMMQQDFKQQKQTMLTSFGHPDQRQLSAEMQAQLQQLSAAQTTIKNALTNDPNNTDLLNLLRWTQQQELDLLEQLYRPQWQSI